VNGRSKPTMLAVINMCAMLAVNTMLAVVNARRSRGCECLRPKGTGVTSSWGFYTDPNRWQCIACMDFNPSSMQYYTP
jgi:hypothetical protein